jgi:2-phosphosulfolactate phosphatase
MDVYSQTPFDLKVEWGIRGAREAAERKEIMIIVDVLSFSSTVATALQFGAEIYPFPPPINEKTRKYAERLGAELSVGRAESIKTGKRSLSPVSFSPEDSGRAFVLCSLNGAACVEAGKLSPALFAGSLRNAKAVAGAAMKLKEETGSTVTIIPCGERWEQPRAKESELRPGIEDYLGAGVILSYMQGNLSPEAFVCRQAFLLSQQELPFLIENCGSGKELIERGFSQDVHHCSQLNVTTVVPILSQNKFIDFGL